MVDYQRIDIDSVFHALANSTRRNIILQLSKRELTVNELAQEHDISLQAVSKHIHVLVRSGLIKQAKEGRTRRCAMNYGPLQSISDLLEEYRVFWEARLDSLEKYLKKTKKPRRK